MNRPFLATLFFIALNLSSYAQLNGGIKGGLNVCDFIVTNSGDVFDEATFNTRVSFHIGSYLQDQFSEQFAWQVEVLFSNKGYVEEIDGQKNIVSLNYLDLPIFLVYKPIELLELEFGPEFGYMITGDDLLNNFDFAFDIGARFNLSSKFNAGMRYSYGLPFKMKLSNEAAAGYDPHYQNGVFQLYLGFNLVNEKRSEQ
ncbi:MAG: outer membrane beta-barrel protein [Bacteroidales bacterium]